MNCIPYVFESVLAGEIIDFFALRKSQGHHPQKEKHIFRSLDQYLIEKNTMCKTLSAPIVEGWVKSLPSNISVNTKIVYISHYSQFAKYLTNIGFTAFIPEQPLREKLYIPYVFSEEEMKRLFEEADNIIAAAQAATFATRDFPLILRILYGCGLRLGEALSLQVKDVDCQSGVLHIRSAKGNRDRLVPMNESLTGILQLYIGLFRANLPTETLLFQNRKGGRISNSRVRSWFCVTLSNANIRQETPSNSRRGICLHCLRHSFAVASFRKQYLAGVDMYSAAPFLSTYMGHDNILGTQTYLHMTEAIQTDIVEQTVMYSEDLFPEVPL